MARGWMCLIGIVGIVVVYCANVFPEKYSYGVGNQNNKSMAGAYKLAGSLQHKAQLICSKGSFDEAHALITRAEKIHDSLREYGALSTDYCLLGDIVRHGDQYMALKYYKHALALALKSGDSSRLSQVYLKTGQIFYALNKKDSALHYEMKALNLSEKIKNDDLKFQIQQESALVLSERGNYDEALKFNLNALLYWKQKSEFHQLVLIYNNLANLYCRKKVYDSAKNYGLMAMLESGKLKDPEIKEKAMQTLSAIYEKAGDYNTALMYLRKDFILKDSLLIAKNQSKVLELSAKFEAEKKEKEIAGLIEARDVQNIILFASITGGIIALFTSITLYYNFRKIKSLSKTLKKQMISLEELNSFKDKLFSVISHDFRGPFTQTGYLLNMISTTEAAAHGHVNKHIKDIELAVQQNIELTDNLLSWASGQIRGIAADPKPLKLKRIIKDCITELNLNIEKKKLVFTDKTDPDIIIFADPAMFRIIIRNLLSNAVKFTPETGKICIDTETISGNLLIRITDTGIGMDSKEINAILSSPVVGSKPGTNQEKGFGIGLKLCKEFIEKNGGELTISSSPGEGSCFIISLKKNYKELKISA